MPSTEEGTSVTTACARMRETLPRSPAVAQKRQSRHDSGARPAQNSGLRMMEMQGFSHAKRTGSRATTAARAPPRTTACAVASGTLGKEGFCQQLECQSSADCEECEAVSHSAAARGRELRLLSVVLRDSNNSNRRTQHTADYNEMPATMHDIGTRTAAGVSGRFGSRFVSAARSTMGNPHLKQTMMRKRSTLSISHTSGARHRLPNSSLLSSPLRLPADLQSINAVGPWWQSDCRRHPR